MPYNPESVLLDFLKKSPESIVSNGGFFNSSQSSRLFLDTLFSSGFFGVALGNIFWCTRFSGFHSSFVSKVFRYAQYAQYAQFN